MFISNCIAADSPTSPYHVYPRLYLIHICRIRLTRFWIRLSIVIFKLISYAISHNTDELDSGKEKTFLSFDHRLILLECGFWTDTSSGRTGLLISKIIYASQKHTQAPSIQKTANCHTSAILIPSDRSSVAATRHQDGDRRSISS